MLECDSPLCVAAATKQASLRQQSMGRSKSFIQKPSPPTSPSSGSSRSAALEAQKRECKARLHVVNAEVVAAKQPARQRELLEERSQLLATIDQCNASLAQLRQSVELDASPAATPRDAPATPRSNSVPVGTVCTLCASAKIGGRVKAEDGSSMWFCRACLMQVAKCARCGKIGKNHTTAAIGGVDGVVCADCAVALKPRAQRHTISVTTSSDEPPPPPLTSSKSVSHVSPTIAGLGVSPARRAAEVPSVSATGAQRLSARRATDAVPSLSASGGVQHSPSRRVDGGASRLSQSSNEGDSPRGHQLQPPGPVSHNSSPAPRRQAISEPPERSPPQPRAKSSSAVSSMKLDSHTAASIWGRGGAPWESFKAPAPRRQLADLLPSTAARPAVSGVECCFACGSEPVGLRVDVERKGRAHAIPLCTSCHISLNSRLARGE